MNKKTNQYTKLIILTLTFILYTFLIETNNVYALENNELNLPARYNLAEHYNIKVENQGQEGNCWAFASLETLETYLQIHGYGTYDFSENHLNYIESNLFTESVANRNINTAANYAEFQDYVDKKFGPVLEEDFPYYEEGTKNYKTYLPSEYESLLNVTPIAYVGEYTSFPRINKEYEEYSDSELLEFRNSVKKHIMENGAIATSIVAPSYYAGSYYNDKTYAAYFSHSSDPSFWGYSHVVAIIGWDDNFSKENFIEGNRPEHDGAYIVLNSWGKDFGDNGIYYISYDDVYVEQDLHGIKEAVTDISELKNTTTFTIKDKNLYNGLKQKLRRILNSYDDSIKSITILTGKIHEITDLDLNDLNITDLSGIENFVDLSSINLSNNNISTIESLKSLHQLSSLDLSNNKFTEVPIELSNSEISRLSLSYNPIENYKNLEKIKNIGVLELEGTNFNDEDLELLANLKISNLNLSKTNTSDYSILKTMEIQQLNISYNKNINYESIPNVMSLDISHTDTNDEQFKKIEDISYINSLDISYTNIKDLSIVPEVLRAIYISGNKNLINFDSLKYVGSIFYQDVELEDLSIFKGFMVSQLNLENNNITDYKDLLENENLMFLNLSNNKLSEIEYSDTITLIADQNNIKPNAVFYGNIDSLKKQAYEQTLKVDINRENIFTDIAYYINSLHSAGYNLIITNATMDYEDNIFKVNDYNKDVIIKITDGKFEESTITYKIEKLDQSDIYNIYVDRSKLKKKYLEGENFDLSELKVYASYDNESISEITDYEVTGGDNLQKGRNTIIVKKDNFTDYIDIDVIAKEDVLTLNFESKDIYNATLEKIKQIEKDRKEYSSYYSRRDVLINNDDENKIIQIYKDDLRDITYIEIISDTAPSLNDIKQLKGLGGVGLNGKEFDNSSLSQLNYIKEMRDSREDLSSFEKFLDLEIKNNDKITAINDNIFKTLTIENSKVKNVNNLSNLFVLQYNGNQIPEMDQILDTLQVVNVNVNTNIKEAQRDDNDNIILPEIFKIFYDKGFKIEVNICDQIRDEQYLYPYNKKGIEIAEKEGKLILDFNKLKEISYDGNNQFIEISVIDTNQYYINFNYKYNMKFKLVEDLEEDSTNPIDIEEDTIPELPESENETIEGENQTTNSRKNNVAEVTNSEEINNKNVSKTIENNSNMQKSTNPKTGDNITIYIIMFICALTGIIVCTIIKMI